VVHEGKCLVMDVDGTLCEIRRPDQEYADVAPIPEVVERLREYREQGFYVILNTARQMRTHQGNVGLITATTAKTLMEWLDRHDVPYDELHVGKPWSGRGGFYVDDKAVRPNEFVTMSYEEILELVSA